MNVTEYIESGILEEYVLGTLNSQEKREVECLSGIYPEIQQELDALSAGLEQYALTLRHEPPADVKERLLQELDFSPTPEESTPDNPSVRPLHAEPTVRSFPTYRYPWLVAASVGLFLLVFAYFLYSQLQNSQQSIASLRSTNDQLLADIQQLKDQQIRSDQALAVLKNQGMRVIRLDAPNKATRNSVLVYWNSQNGLVNLDIDSLARPSEVNQYQLWAIVDGKPVDAGVFDIGDTTRLIQQPKKFLRADAFAITLERRGGSPTPTLDAMVAIGNVKS